MLILVSKSQRKAFDRLVFMVCDILLQFFYPILKYVPIAYFRAGDAVDFNIDIFTMSGILQAVYYIFNLEPDTVEE